MLLQKWNITLKVLVTKNNITPAELELEEEQERKEQELEPEPETKQKSEKYLLNSINIFRLKNYKLAGVLLLL